MRPTTFLFASSLLANATLAWLVFTPAATPTISHPTLPAPSHAAPAPTPTAAATTPTALRERLLALGFSADATRIALRAHLEAPRLARLRELRATTTALPWWHGINGVRFTPEQERELSALRRTEREELTRLFGPAGTVNATEIEPYLFLPPEKAARLAALERDYTELRAQLTESALSDPAAVDERRRTLNAERTRDLAALLDADELAALDRRRSPTAQVLARRFPYFEGSEAEYRALYDLQKSFHEKFPPPGNGSGISIGSGNESSARAQLAADEQAALGAERFTAWQLSVRADYRTLLDLQQRFDLPPATIATMASLPSQIGAESTRIGDDQSLTLDQKLAALKTLAAQARDRVRQVLGADLGTAYFSAGAGIWLTPLDRGASFTFNHTGGGGIRQIGPNPPRP